jgi:hypothetical protein
MDFQKLPEVARDCQELMEIARGCEKCLEVARDWQELMEIARDCERLAIFPIQLLALVYHSKDQEREEQYQ